MIWVRKTLAYLLSLPLLATLLLGVLAFNLNTHFAKPDNLENWLSQSKIYDHFVGQVISQSQQSIGSSPQSDSVSLSDATVQQAAQNAFSPQLLQDSVNKFISANYDWLQSKTSKPDFSIDLSQAKQSFANQVGQYVTARFSSLPVCSQSQLVQLQNQNIDPLAAPCRPAFISAASEGTNVTRQLADSNEFLSNPVLTADNFQPKNTGSQPYYQKLSFAPTIYHWSQTAPAILAILAILLALAVFFLLPRRKGLRRIAGTLLLAGILLIATRFVSDFVTTTIQHRAFSNTNIGQLQQSLTDVLHRASDALAATDFYFGIAFVLLALTVFVILIVTRGSRQPKAEPPETPTNPTGPTEIPQASSIPSSTDSPQTQPTGAPPLKKNHPKSKHPNLVQ